MRVVIAGGHGKIALRLAARLSARGDTPPTAGLTLELVGSDTPVDEAVAATVGT